MTTIHMSETRTSNTGAVLFLLLLAAVIYGAPIGCTDFAEVRRLAMEELVSDGLVRVHQ